MGIKMSKVNAKEALLALLSLQRLASLQDALNLLKEHRPAPIPLTGPHTRPVNHQPT